MNMFDSNFDYTGDFIDRWNGSVKRTRIWMIVFAVLLILAGVFAAAAPYSLYALIQGVASVAFLVLGIVQIGSFILTPELFRSATSVVMGVLNVLLGICLMTLPAYLTAQTLVFLLAFLFIMTGIERISFSHRMKYFQLPHTGMGMATGIINIILGVVFLLLPMVSSLVLSYIVAAYLVVGGATLLIEALAMRRIER